MDIAEVVMLIVEILCTVAIPFIVKYCISKNLKDNTEATEKESNILSDLTNAISSIKDIAEKYADKSSKEN